MLARDARKTGHAEGAGAGDTDQATAKRDP
jgi:hypothetical protein